MRRPRNNERDELPVPSARPRSCRDWRSPERLERARFYHGRRSSLGQQIIEFCKTSFRASYKFIGGIDPTRAGILACPHLTRLLELKLLLNACLLLLAPRYETIRRSHGALLELLSFSDTTLILAAELPSIGATCLLVALSGHRKRARRCQLWTQSGHRKGCNLVGSR